MKTVFTNSQIAHVWANQTQNEGKTANRTIFFDESGIYSYGYHFCIAKHMENEKGKFILFTNRGYSNTTAKHINLVSYASKHINRVRCYFPDKSITDNLQSWLDEAKNTAKFLIRAKKPVKYIQQLQGLYNEASNYVEYMGFGSYKIDKKQNKAIFRELEQICKIEKGEQIEQIIEKERELQRKRELKLQRQKAKEHKEELQKFRNGDNFSIYKINHSFDYLRLNEDKTRIETTQNVQILVKFIPSFVKALKSGNIDNLQIQNYTIREYNNKFLQIGCHKIEIKEANQILKALNLELL